MNISRQMLFIMVRLVWHYTTTWQDCCRRGESRSWPSVSVESVDSEYWCLNNAIVYAFIMRLTVEERGFILESYLKTMSYVQKFLGVVCHWVNKLLILKYGPYGLLLSWTPGIYIIIIINILTAIGLAPGSSSQVHIYREHYIRVEYTNNTQNT